MKKILLECFRDSSLCSELGKFVSEENSQEEVDQVYIGQHLGDRR